MVHMAPAGNIKAGYPLYWKKRVLIVLGMALLIGTILMIVALLQTALFLHDGIPVPASLSLGKVDMIDKTLINNRTARFSQALQINTTSVSEGDQNFEGLLLMHELLEINFPHIHTSPFINREVINNYSLLYTIEGSVPGKLPYLLASHLDVVPAEPASWEVPPFSGQVVNNTFIYGRGAIDDKIGVMAIMEALEHMLLKGERPLRTLFLSFGHDEEIGGKNGAKNIAAALNSRGIKVLDFILDEGFSIRSGVMKQINQPVAMISVAEKGLVYVELTVTGNPGHSSSPPKESSIGILGAAVAKLETNPQPARIVGPVEDTFKYMVPFMDFRNKFLYTNLWLFSNIVAGELGDESVTNPLIRTTTAVTIIHAGIKSNVVPSSAKAIVNHRVHPSETVAQAIAYDKKIISDSRVNISILDQREPSRVSPYANDDAVQFQLIATSVKQVYPEAVVVPSVLTANTDTYWYTDFTKNIYRFTPAIVNPVNYGSIHGNNEKISIENYHQAVNFYYRVIKNADLMMNTVP